MASEFELTLESFAFPATLPNSRANFRFVVDVRMVRSGKFATDTAVMPGFDTWWECDRKKTRHPLYVRLAGAPALDMDRIDAWERLVLLTRADSLHSLQLKVFDVDRPDAWDTLRDALGRIAQSVLGRTSRALELQDIAAEGFGAVEEDVRSSVAKRLAGGDRLLYRGSAPLDAPGPVTLGGRGVGGDYAAAFRLAKR
ncbi:MAG TPA: hypothetical protein VMS86_06135 [Thermoanaerobaculia bacterium]|nr:hypothetical protein [Thermoanaerobaculia bacterium]